MKQFILPPDVFWLLRVPVAPGSSTPFHLWMWYHWQFTTPKGNA
jgi:hypothetical protein